MFEGIEGILVEIRVRVCVCVCVCVNSGLASYHIDPILSRELDNVMICKQRLHEWMEINDISDHFRLEVALG